VAAIFLLDTNIFAADLAGVSGLTVTDECPIPTR